MSVPKKHHFLPEFYLKSWADPEGRVWSFRRPHRQLDAKLVYPSETGFVPHLTPLRLAQNRIINRRSNSIFSLPWTGALPTRCRNFSNMGLQLWMIPPLMRGAIFLFRRYTGILGRSTGYARRYANWMSQALKRNIEQSEMKLIRQHSENIWLSRTAHFTMRVLPPSFQVY